MWAIAASLSKPYSQFQDHFYRCARKYLEYDELKGRGDSVCTLAHVQSWALLAIYEQKMMYHVRGWLSIRKAAALCILQGLQKVDGIGLTTIETLPPPSDLIDLEQRRRTFWLVFVQDRYASLGSGKPMSFNEKEVCRDTNDLALLA